MSRPVALRELAHARAGDKGNRSSVGLFVYDARHYDLVARQVTPERLKRELGGVLKGPIRRYDLPQLGGFNFVMDDGLEGGVNQSLNLDGHGKSWSFLLLGLTVEIED
ncbi:MAG: hypothetical protein FJX68_07345 [Alphaproteobacteria bacterium]|nr:hypothetical protein [Alphaproteobacteria bacterium]